MAPVITKAWKCKKQDFSHQAQDKYASRLVLCFNGLARALAGGRHQKRWSGVITSQ